MGEKTKRKKMGKTADGLPGVGGEVVVGTRRYKVREESLRSLEVGSRNRECWKVEEVGCRTGKGVDRFCKGT